MTTTSLVTLEDAYLWLSITGDTSGYDAKMQDVIDAATMFVQRMTGPILPQTYTETHDGGGQFIVVDNPPILTVTSVTEYVGAAGYPLTQETLGTDVGAYGFSFEPRGTIWRRTSGNIASRFVGGGRNIAVTYVGGTATIAADVRTAVLEDIRGLFTQTQYGSPATVGGAGSSADESWTSSAFNPVAMFPRLAALLEGPSRAPSIA